MAETDSKCKVCWYWKDGLCKRYPPYTIVRTDSMSGEVKTVWPMPDKNDWCGEFKKA